MADVNYTQSNFSRGEIDDRLLARFDYDGYTKFLKRARNCLTIPQGPIQSRFGTKYVGSISNVGSEDEIEMATFLFNDIATYVYVFISDTIYVYLENILVFTINSTGYLAPDIKNLRFSQVETRMVVTNPNYHPKNIVGPSTSGPANITAFDGADETLTAVTSVTVGTICPVSFATGTSLPVTVPQIATGRTYFMRSLASNKFKVYGSAADAANDVNNYQISSAGTSATASAYDQFTIANISFKNLPTYDFGASYSVVTFTPNPTTIVNIGASIVIDASGGTPFTSAYVGGIFSSGGGVMRITTVNSSSKITGYLISQFPDDGDLVSPVYIPMNGALSFLGEPAWSDARGWPRCSTFFQNRLWFGGTVSIPNGVWGSVVNDARDFDDSESLDDNAIAYYPASGSMSFVQSMTSTRSLLVHTTTGTYSTPLTTDFPVTPSSISFVEQNKDGVSQFQPIVIDNQVLFVDSSQNNVKNLIWEFAQSAYVLRNISITSSSLIRKPTDIANFSNPLFIDGSYAFLTNDDGTLACFQTLYTEDVAGWTLANSEQRIDGNTDNVLVNEFSHVASSLERVWFIMKRQKLAAQSPSAITGVASNVFTLTSSPITEGGGINGSDVFYAVFGGVSLPTTSPQVTNARYYYVKRQSSDSTIKVYDSYDDAVNDKSAFTLTNIGTTATCTISLLADTYTVEELDFETLMDSTVEYTQNTGTLTGLSQFNGMYMQVKADGYVFPPQQVFNGQLTFYSDVRWNLVQVGFPFTVQVTLLPVNNVLTTGPNFYKPKLLRQFYLYYYQTVGADINGTTFPVTPIGQYEFDAPAEPQTGIISLPPMMGWDPLSQDITVTQSNPLPLTILGYSLSVEIK